jgi:hypothetical protein
MKIVQFIESISSPNKDFDRRVRIAFWISGLTLGAITCYTTRFRVTGDAIPYIEMAEFFRAGYWSALVNLTWSPLYPFILSIAQYLFQTDPPTEIITLKIVNYCIFLFAMAACDLLLTTVRRQYGLLSEDRKEPIPFHLVSAAVYTVFLFTALDWVRISYMAPDMLALTFFLILTAIVVWINESSDSYSKFALLGAIAAFAYFSKTYLLLISIVFFSMAFLACASLKKAIPRILTTIVVLAVLISPLVYFLSERAGRFSYGEAGNFNYANNMGSKGKAVHPPMILSEDPDVEVYLGHPFGRATDPRNIDTAWWYLGLTPDFTWKKQLNMVMGCVIKVIEDSPWLLLAMVVFLVSSWSTGGLRLGNLWPLPALILIPAIAGFSMFCLVQVDMRYIAPFFVTGVLGLTLIHRNNKSPENDKRYRFITVVCALMVFLIWGAFLQRNCPRPRKELFFVRDNASHCCARYYSHLSSVSPVPAQNLSTAGTQPSQAFRIRGPTNLILVH